jgi:hypothetical protein
MRFREIKEDGWDDLISQGMTSMLSTGSPTDLTKYFTDFSGDSNSKSNAKGSQPTAKTATSSDASKPSKGPVNTQQIASYLSSKGLSSQHVAGIMANIKHESNFNPGAVGDGGTSGGLFQHHGPRFQAMVNAAGPNWKTNWKGQIDFALSEPAGRQYASMKFRTAQEASKWFTINFEVPANKVAKANDRSRDANQFA